VEDAYKIHTLGTILQEYTGMEMHHTVILHPSENVGELLLHSSVSSDQHQTMTQTQSFAGQVKRSGSATVQYLHGFHCTTKNLLQSPASRTRSANNNQKKILKNIINQKGTSESKSKAETKTMVDSAPWKRDDNNRNPRRFSWHQSFGLDLQKLPTSWTHYSRKKSITKEKKRKGKKKGEREKERTNMPDVLEAITMIGSMFRYEIEEQNHARKTNIASVGCKT
jgi:hypothetical protein